MEVPPSSLTQPPRRAVFGFLLYPMKVVTALISNPKEQILQKSNMVISIGTLVSIIVFAYNVGLNHDAVMGRINLNTRTGDLTERRLIDLNNRLFRVERLLTIEVGNNPDSVKHSYFHRSKR